MTIAEPLDRSSAATVTLTVQATDTSAIPPQHGLATLVVTIVDVNDFEPVFPEPWTKENPYITIQVSEELPRGSIVHKFVATDPDSNIDKFRIMPKSEFFSIEPETGNLKVSTIEGGDRDRVERRYIFESNWNWSLEKAEFNIANSLF